MTPACESPVISQISPARFHHIELCKQLEARGLLGSLYTAYPKGKLEDDGLPMQKLRSFPWFWPLYVLRLRGGHQDDALTRWLHYTAHWTLSRYAAASIARSDAVVALSGSGLEAGRAIKRAGGVWICDRGSTHILYQDQLLREEHKTWGMPFPGIDQRMIERETTEYAECHRVVVPSEFAVRSFVRQGVPEDKIVKIPYGVNLADFSPGERESDGVFRVLFVGGVSLQKGIQYLLPAFAKLEGRVELVIVGHGDFPERLYQGVDTTRVRWAGRQPKKAVKEWMRRSDVLVLPSVQDGFGLVLAEAMACGCPVIGTTHTGILDLAEDGVHGFVVPPRDVDALAEAMQKLVDDPELRRQMSLMALDKVKNLGGWETYGESLVELVKGLLAGQVLGDLG